MTKISIIFRGGYDKGYKFFIAIKILFVCIIIYFNKNRHFRWIAKKCKNYKIFFKIQALLIYELVNKNHLKTLMTKISHISWEGYDKCFYGSTITTYILFKYTYF